MTQPSTKYDPYFTGGFSTFEYGSVSGSTIDAIQAEVNVVDIGDTEENMAKFIETTANILLDILEIHYKLNNIK